MFPEEIPVTSAMTADMSVNTLLWATGKTGEKAQSLNGKKTTASDSGLKCDLNMLKKKNAIYNYYMCV